MDLKNINAITSATSQFNEVLSKGTKSNRILAATLSGVDTQAKIAIVSQSSLTHAQKMGILATSGLTDEELKNASATLSVSGSQTVATGTTNKFALAMKGLATKFKAVTASMKAFVLANPAVMFTAVTTALVTGSVALVNYVQNWANGTVAIKNSNKVLEKSRELVEENENAISEHSFKIEENNEKIKELQELYDNGTITDAQRAEIENLKYQNELLDEKIKKLQDINDEEAKKQVKATIDKFNAQFGDDNAESNNSDDVYNRYIKDRENDRERIYVDINSGNASDTSKLMALKYFTDEFNKTIENGTAEDIELYSELLTEAKTAFSSVQDDLWEELQSAKAMLESFRGTELFDEETYNNIISWENIFKSYVEEYKKAAEKVQEEASKNPVEVEVDFKTLVADLNTLLQTLTDNASLLSSINKEISETNQISADNLTKISEAFPDDKYPEMTKALYDYQLGIIDSVELFEQLEKAYDSDTDNYIEHLTEMSANDTEFWQSVYDNCVELQETLTSLYGQEANGFKNATNAKELIYEKFINTLKGKYADYLEFVIKGENGLYKLADLDTEVLPSNILEGDSAGAEILGKADMLYSDKEAIAEIKKLIKDVNAQNTAIDEAIEEQLRKNLNLDWATLGGSDKSSSSSDTTKSYDLIEIAIQKLERRISSLNNMTDDMFASWSDRNKALLEQISATTEEIELQRQAQAKYMQLADSTGLSSFYKNLIQNGAIDEIVISNKDLQEQIDAYQSYYNKAMEASDAIKTLQNNLNELEQSKSDIISNESENTRKQLDHITNMINSYINLAETSGRFASESSYKDSIANYQDILASLYDEKEKLENQMAQSISKGTLKEGTQAWSEMKSQINDVNEAILDTIINIRDMSNEIMNINFEKFEYMQDKISGLISEADFFISYIDSMGKDLYDDNGKFTDDGITTVGLHNQNLNTYLQKVKDYADKIAEIEKDIANDPLNNTLVEKKQEYIEAQRDAVLAAQDERNAIIDLVKNGYDKQIESLDETISKYRDLMSVQRDAYDYEKQMADKTKELASLQKQYMAWQNDTSEQGMKVRQELDVKIQDAKDDIEQSEYDKMISDAEKILDTLQTEYESLINERIDTIDSELQNITTAVNDSAGIIADKIQEISKDTNIPLTSAMLNIWKDAQPVTDINTTVDTVNNTLSGTNIAIDKLRGSVQDILAKMDSVNASEMENTVNRDNNVSNNTTPSTPSTTNTQANNSNNSKDELSAKNDDWSDDWLIRKVYSSKKDLNIKTSVVDRLKYNDIDASMEARKQYWDKLIGEGEYHGTYDQNLKMLNWLKQNGYKNGTRYAKKGWHWTQEDGQEFIIRKSDGAILTPLNTGDMVFNNESSKRLYELAQDPESYVAKLGLNNFTPQFNVSMPKLPEVANRNVSNKVDLGGVHIGQVVANDPVEFATKLNNELARNLKTKKILQERVLGESFGHHEGKARSFL